LNKKLKIKDMIDYTQIEATAATIISVISFTMYFPLKRKESRAKSENDNVNTLSKVVDELRGELERKGINMKLLEEQQETTQNRVTVLESEIEKYNLALSAVSLCETYKHGGYCPIINKIKNENKTKRSTKNGSKKENGCKKGGNVCGFKKD